MSRSRVVLEYKDNTRWKLEPMGANGEPEMVNKNASMTLC